jgi:signal peptidase I
MRSDALEEGWWLMSTRCNKEPWLAASLSWLLPGAGDLYRGAYLHGVLLLALGGALYASWVVSFVSAKTGLGVPWALQWCTRMALPTCAAIIALRGAKRRNIPAFQEDRTTRKDIWLAVFLNLLVPGLGHFYLRRRLSAILFFLGFVFSFCTYAVLGGAFRPVGPIVLRAGALVHLYIRCGPTHSDGRRVFVPFIFFVLGAYSLGRILAPVVIDCCFVKVYGPINGLSMVPTLPENSYVVVDKFTYLWRTPSVGEMVGFTPPENEFSFSGMPECKRIVATGGETVSVAGDTVYINGKERDPAVNRIRLVHPGSGQARLDDPCRRYAVNMPYVVPEGHYFVLGDNRPTSIDSRCFGAVPRSQIIGRIGRIVPPR